jgi:hypothetical protein
LMNWYFARTCLEFVRVDIGLALQHSDVGLIRFGGHLSYGEYDVQTDARHTEATSTSPVH